MARVSRPGNREIPAQKTLQEMINLIVNDPNLFQIVAEEKMKAIVAMARATFNSDTKKVKQFCQEILDNAIKEICGE